MPRGSSIILPSSMQDKTRISACASPPPGMRASPGCSAKTRMNQLIGNRHRIAPTFACPLQHHVDTDEPPALVMRCDQLKVTPHLHEAFHETLAGFPGGMLPDTHQAPALAGIKAPSIGNAGTSDRQHAGGKRRTADAFSGLIAGSPPAWWDGPHPRGVLIRKQVCLESRNRRRRPLKQSARKIPASEAVATRRSSSAKRYHRSGGPGEDPHLQRTWRKISNKWRKKSKTETG